MGIRSLTTYLEYRSRQYFEPYQLHDCNLIIDGSSLAFHLYNWEYSFFKTGYSFDCYGGDYDKYTEIVKGFFNMLDICNVNPLIVFGGRNGIDRVSIVKKRIEEKVKVASEITPDHVRNEIKNMQQRRRGGPIQGLTVGAVALKYVFRDIVNELKLRAYVCNEEPNREIACLAKELRCPVLSANSDFFVLGSMFIPFSSLSPQIEANRGKWRTSERGSDQFIPCKLYKIEKLLYVLNKRPDNNFIPYLIPVLLGSDYIKQELFEPFYQSLRIQGSRQQKIDGIFNWIKEQNSLEGSLKQILDSFHNTEERNSASRQINHTIMGYSPVSVVTLLKHFDIGSNTNPGRTFQNSMNLGKVHGLNSGKKDIGKKEEIGSELFESRVRECRYPSFFMDVLMENRYLLLNNIEDNTKPDANSIGYTIMSAIHNILVQNDEKQLTVIRRHGYTEIEEYTLPTIEDQLPSIEEIDYLLPERQKDILLKVLDIEQSFCDIFDGLSKEWQLFLLSLKYCSSKSHFDAAFIYSLILCFIILNYVDLNLKGFYRTVKDFQEIDRVSQNEAATSSGTNEFPKISERDSYYYMQKCIKYFEMDKEDNAETYDRTIMHSIAEFQCVFMQLECLNNLLQFYFENMSLYKVFDGTFVYNMTKNLRNVRNLKDYLNNFLQDCSSIQSGFLYVVELLERYSIV